VPSVEVVGAVDLRASSSGWAGWGLVAGLLAIVVAALAVAGLRGRSAPLALVAASLGMLCATMLAVFTGSADIRSGAVGVEVDATRWPALSGLALAVVVAGAGLASAISSPSPGATGTHGRRPAARPERWSRSSPQADGRSLRMASSRRRSTVAA
jgi:hypothetical protein